MNDKMVPPPKYYDSKFNICWLEKKELKDWLKPHPDSNYLGYCTICKTDIHLKRIRLSAITRHSKGEKHRNILSMALQHKPTMLNFFTKTKSNTLPSEEPIQNSSSESSVIQVLLLLVRWEY